MSNRENNNGILSGLAIGASVAAALGVGAVCAMHYFGGSRETEIAHTSDSWRSSPKEEEKKIAHTSGSGRLLDRNRIEVIETERDCLNAVFSLRYHCDEYQVLGFDCKWVGMCENRRPIALLQLASQEYCALLRLCSFDKIPQDLIDLLEDANIIKVGVNPHISASNLKNDFRINVLNTLDLRIIAEDTKYEPASLAKMAKSVLNVNLNQNFNVVTGWEANKLKEEQILYAADNAIAAIKIFEKCFDQMKLHSSKKFTPLEMLNEEYKHLYGTEYRSR